MPLARRVSGAGPGRRGRRLAVRHARSCAIVAPGWPRWCGGTTCLGAWRTSLEEVGVRLEPLPAHCRRSGSGFRVRTPRGSLRHAGPVTGRDAHFEPHPARPSSKSITLSFRYPGASPRPVLSDIRLSLEAGELAAIVGANGAGKTTLARHLVRILKPPLGRMLLAWLDKFGSPRPLGWSGTSL